MNQNLPKGPKKDAAKIITNFRKDKGANPRSEILEKALKNWPEKEKTNSNKKVALPDAEI